MSTNVGVDKFGWPVRWIGLERVCSRPTCRGGDEREVSREFRIDGYCSIECRDFHEYETEILALKADLRSAMTHVPDGHIVALSRYGLDTMKESR